MNAPAAGYVQATAPWMPQSIAGALADARLRVQPPAKSGRGVKDGREYFYLQADDVVRAGEAAMRAAGLTLVHANAELGCLQVRNGVLVVKRFAWLLHKDGDSVALGIQSWPLPNKDDLSEAMSTAMTMSDARIYRTLLAMVGVGAEREETDAQNAVPAGRSNEVREFSRPKKHTAKQTMAWAEANGIKPSADVSEREQREEAEEAARVEAEKKANDDPRFKDEKPLADPPGLMDDEPTVPPDSAETFDGQTKDEAGPSGSASVHIPAKSPEPGTSPGSGPTQPDSEASSTSEVKGERCKLAAPESTPAATSTAGDSNSGPNFLDQGEWAGVKSVSSAGGTASPSGPPAPGPSDVLVQPTPGEVAAVSKVAESVLSKRTAEGRAGKWAKAVTRKARKAAMCDVCQETDGAGIPKGPHEAAIKVGDKHKDSGNGPRCCWTCWERLESEAAGAGKESAA